MLEKLVKSAYANHPGGGGGNSSKSKKRMGGLNADKGGNRVKRNAPSGEGRKRNTGKRVGAMNASRSKGRKGALNA